jgi:hypothetical protein
MSHTGEGGEGVKRRLRELRARHRECKPSRAPTHNHTSENASRNAQKIWNEIYYFEKHEAKS